MDIDETATQKQVEPCLWITHVNDNSPAQDAGLLLADAFLQVDAFTPTKEMALEKIQEQIKTILEQSINQSLKITVLRKSLFGDESQVEVTLTPKEWSGMDSTGLLGCQLKKEAIF